MDPETVTDNLVEKLFPERYPYYLLSKTTWARILTAKNEYTNEILPDEKRRIISFMKKDLDGLHTPLYNDNEKLYLKNKASTLLRTKNVTDRDAETVWQEECCKTVRKLHL
jgi:hypothetical protein